MPTQLQFVEFIDLVTTDLIVDATCHGGTKGDVTD